MSELRSIRTMQQLEHHRALLLQKAAGEERKIRRDIDSIKDDYKPVVNTVNGIRSGIATLRVVLPVILPVLRFFWRRRNSKR